MIAIDIETIPDLNKVDCLPEPEAPGNYKDPEKIAAYKAEKKKEMVDKMALSPFTGKICSFALWGEETIGNYVYTVKDTDDSSEIELIKDALEYFCIHSNYKPEICTWNGFKFDLPFLFKRAMLLKVELPAGLPSLKTFSKKYDISFHIDLAQEIEQWNGGYMSLDQAARYILGDKKDEIDVCSFRDLILAGKSDEISQYNLKDAELTYRIYQACNRYIF